MVLKSIIDSRHKQGHRAEGKMESSKKTKLKRTHSVSTVHSAQIEKKWYRIQWIQIEGTTQINQDELYMLTVASHSTA